MNIYKAISKELSRKLVKAKARIAWQKSMIESMEEKKLKLESLLAQRTHERDNRDLEITRLRAAK